MSWVKLHRQLFEWEWFSSEKHLKVFITLLVKANFKETKWRGEVVKKGQILTGRKQLASWCNLTEQSIRTVLNDLKSTNEITIKSTKHFSIITMTKWDYYQCDNQQINQQINQLANQQVTNGQPTANQQVTTSKEGKKVKKVKNIASQKKPAIKNEECTKYIEENYSILDTEVQEWLQAASLSSLKRIRAFSSDQALLGTIPDAMEYAVDNNKKYSAIGSFLLGWIRRSSFSHERDEYERSLAFVAMMKKAEQKEPDAED
jgi:hypothetical protein